MAVDNYYEILGINSSADEDTIRGAIRKTRSRYRQVAGSPNREQARNAEVMIEKLAKAEAMLLNPDAKPGYDAQLAAQPAPSPEPVPIGGGSTSWIETAKSYLANGQPRNAARAAQEATRAEPASVDAWTVRAYAALELKDFQDADFSASEAQKRDPGNPQMFGLLADVCDGEGRFADAQRAFSRAAELEPTNPYWSGRVAWALGDQGNFEGAITYARQLVAHFPASQYVKDTLANQLLREADGALSRHPHNGSYFTNKKQIAHFEARIAEVEALRPLHESAEGALADAKGHLAIGKKRRFIWPGMGTLVRVGLYVVLGAWILLWICSAIAGDAFGTILWLGANAALAWRIFNKVLPLQTSVNRLALGPFAKTGLQ